MEKHYYFAVARQVGDYHFEDQDLEIRGMAPEGWVHYVRNKVFRVLEEDACDFHEVLKSFRIDCDQVFARRIVDEIVMKPGDEILIMSRNHLEHMCFRVGFLPSSDLA